MKRSTYSVVQALQALHYRQRILTCRHLSTDKGVRTKTSTAYEPRTTEKAMASSSTPTVNRPPAVSHVLETALMMKDVPAATEFYKDLLGVEPFLVSVSVFS